MLIKALPAGITDFLVVGALVVFGQVFEVGETDISTACTMLLAIVGFVILYNISKPMNALRWCVWGGCIVGLLGCSIYLEIYLQCAVCLRNALCCLWYLP